MATAFDEDEGVYPPLGSSLLNLLRAVRPDSGEHLVHRNDRRTATQKYRYGDTRL